MHTKDNEIKDNDRMVVLRAYMRESNKRFRMIDKELHKYGMHLCLDAVFKGEYPYCDYVGHMDNYEEIIDYRGAKGSDIQKAV